MCLINFSFQQHPSYPFILVGNRDEFYDRPTAPLQWWQNTDILAGKDLKEGGTWMGISKKGNFAALTNYRETNSFLPTAPSRGILTQKFISGALSLEEMHRYLKTHGRTFNGFNLIYGTASELYYYSNKTDIVRQLYPGIYGLSNALLDTPWQKVVKSKEQFKNFIASPINIDAILLMMQDKTEADDASLPQTGVSADWEKRLSAMFITSEKYGTRLTTFVSINNKGCILYREKGYVPEHDIKFEFNLLP